MQTVHCEWGLNGVRTLRERCKVLVIIDVLSFTSAVDIAVSRGAIIVPFPYGDREAAARAADAAGAVLANPKRAGGEGQFSLSPVSLQSIPAGTRLMLPSPNGSRLSLEGGDATIFAGCLRNAKAVAAAALRAADGGDIGVIPAGERWKNDDTLRPAIEDALGAGAIIAALDREVIAEARFIRDSFVATGDAVGKVVSDSMSGQELIGWGFAEDVELAIQRDVSHTAPRLIGGVYTAITG